MMNEHQTLNRDKILDRQYTVLDVSAGKDLKSGIVNISGYSMPVENKRPSLAAVHRTIDKSWHISLLPWVYML